MAKYSKFNIIYLIQKWMDSVAGQTFMNYAYSWGAAVVILGTLFKLTHLPGANVMLFIGMGTEVFVFFIAAFDRPFDKTAEGRNLATDSELAAQLGMLQGTDNPEVPAGTTTEHVDGPVITGGGNGGTIIIGGGNGGSIPQGAGISEPVVTDVVTDVNVAGEGNMQTAAGGPVVLGGGVAGNVAPTPAPAVSPETAEAMEDVTKTYIERLEQLNETLLKVSALSEKLSIDSEEMENLNRTLTGIARVYEMQLKSASQQITTQDDINSQTRKMAESIAELNSCYARMIEAMTVNVPGAAPK